MPLKPLRCCTTPNCSNKVVSGACTEHSRQAEQHRGSQRARGYTRRWEHAARAFKEQFPLCGQRPNGQPPVMSVCFDEGRVKAAHQVDHVVPHKGNPVLFWDAVNNWQSLCASCGSRKTRAGL